MITSENHLYEHPLERTKCQDSSSRGALQKATLYDLIVEWDAIIDKTRRGSLPMFIQAS